MSDIGATVVITGASAGVGRACAIAFARRGWRIALLAREPSALEATKAEVENAGGMALTFPLDVSDGKAVFAAAQQIVERWPAIDVWINNAMATVYGPVSDISIEEFRRVTEVTYHGYVFGTMAALKTMRQRNAGTIVQVGSALAYRAIPLQSAYCGAKFAIRGFTDALRSELQHEKSRVRVTMVHLPAVNTPQFNWGRNKMPRRPQPMGPIHQPEPIGEAIFRASQEAPREVWIGAASVKAILGTMLIPGLLDRLLARKGYDGQMTAEPAAGQPDNLFEPARGGHAMHGRFDARARDGVSAFKASVVRAAVMLFAVVLALATAGIAVWLIG
jgi:NAD(P)-dependent dehydrogenase (short-subunit alcohol dehydrogenase family)